MVMAAALGFASVAAILAWSRMFFPHGWAEPKVVYIVAGLIIAWTWKTGTASKRLQVVLLGIILTQIPATMKSINLPSSLVGLHGILSGSLLTTIICCAGCFLAAHIIEAQKARLIKKLIFAAGCMCAAVCIGQVFGADPFHLPTSHGRVGGLLGSPIHAGALFVILLTMAPLNPLLWAGILCTQSAGAILAGFVSVAPQNWRVLAFMLATLIGMVGVWRSHSDSNNARRLIWSIAWEHRSTLGTGPATFLATFQKHRDQFAKIGLPSYVQDHAHNAVLEQLVCCGIAGLIGLLLVGWLSPSMAGLWTICMFNPMSFEVIFIAAVLVGLNFAEQHPEGAAS